MQPTVIVAEATGHRARFAWLGAALAATIAIVVASSVMRDAPRAREPSRVERFEQYRVHRCGKAAFHRERALREAERAAREAERAQHHALREAARAERRALREAERAERRALREAERVRLQAID